MAPSSSDSLGFDQGERAQESEAHALALKIEENHRGITQLYTLRVGSTVDEYEDVAHAWRPSQRADYVDDHDHTMWALVRWDDNQRRWTAPMGPVKEWQEEMIHLAAPTAEQLSKLTLS